MASACDPARLVAWPDRLLQRTLALAAPAPLSPAVAPAATAGGQLPSALVEEDSLCRRTAVLVYVNGSRVRRLLVQQGRKYRLAAIASDGSALYRGRRGGETDYWIRTGDGIEVPWHFRTCFGRRRPLPPPSGERWLAAAPGRVERRSPARRELTGLGYLGLPGAD